VGREIPRLRVVYYDGRPDDVIVCGQWEVNLAERKHGEGSVSRGNLDAITYAAYLGAKRSGAVEDGVSYEAWAPAVAQTEAVEPGESPAPPGT
jgi:hypothetical protein